MNTNSDKCVICGAQNLSQIFDNYIFCGNCKTAWKISETRLIPASPNENNELVYNHSKKGLFSEGLKTILKLTGRKGRILDIGCGHGYFLKMARDSGWAVEGIEIADSHAEHGRKNFGLTIYNKPLSELRLPDNSYDAVTLWSVLDVVPDPLAELKEIYRVLKPGGVLYLRINNFTYNHFALLLGNTILLKLLRVAPGILLRWGITKTTLEKLFSFTDFRNVHIYNSKMTSGDPYGTGGRLGGFMVGAAKHIYYIISQIIYLITFGRLTIASSILVTASK